MLLRTKNSLQDYFTDRAYLSGLATGLVAGLAAGLLLAPKSGKKMRKHLAGTLSDASDAIQHQWKKAENRADKSIDSLKSSVSDFTEKAQDQFENYADKAGSKAHKLADDLKDKF